MITWFVTKMQIHMLLQHQVVVIKYMFSWCLKSPNCLPLNYLTVQSSGKILRITPRAVGKKRIKSLSCNLLPPHLFYELSLVTFPVHLLDITESWLRLSGPLRTIGNAKDQSLKHDKGVLIREDNQACISFLSYFYCILVLWVNRNNRNCSIN